jgi:hypothetical protein
MIAYVLAFASSILTSISYGFGYIWCGFCLCTAYYGYPLYQVKNKEKVTYLMTKIKWSSMRDENNKARWWFIGDGFIGTFAEVDKGQMAYIMCSSSTFKNLTEMNGLHVKSETISIYERNGSYYWLDYSKRDFDVDKYICQKKQFEIIEKTADLYKIRKSFVIFIYGGPGSGKSMCSILLAKELKGSLVRTFDPTEPGDTLASLYSTVSPTDDNPLILVLDEVNILFHKVYHGLIIPHKHIPIQISNKNSLNRFFDDINLGLYPYLIIVMTSNISAKEIETNYDPSYIREGRVDLRFNLEKDDEICNTKKNIDELSSNKICANTQKIKFLKILKFLKIFLK